tara:strand:+ start:7210 stop:8019 length:810 start_codon:yes stop_codon:yes gene_type:complete
MIYQGTAYNYNQRSEILLPNRGGTTYYGPQNHKPLIIYAGLDIDLEFFVKTPDRKPVNLSNKTFVAKIVDRSSNSVILTKTLAVVDYTSGNLVMKIVQGDTNNFGIGLYDLVITYTDSQSRTFGLSSDQNGRISFVLEIKDNPLGIVITDSAVNDTFIASGQAGDTSLYTNRSAGTAQTFNQDGTNTCAVYTTGYTGVLYAQGTLESNPTESDWFNIQLDPEVAEDSWTFTNSTSVTPFTWDGMFMWVRFYHTPDAGNTGTLDKVLYRS